MLIDETTKISAIIAADPRAIDAIVSLSPHFEKLRIPVLRKVLAPRVTIRQAAKIGGVTTLAFFEKLEEIGFVCSSEVKTSGPSPPETGELNLQGFPTDRIVDLDVRPLLHRNTDPFRIITETLKSLPEEKVLRIINSFEPLPLINILKKRGYIYKTVFDGDTVCTYFKQQNKTEQHLPENYPDAGDEEEMLLNRFQGKIVETDVRELAMPLPLSTILNKLLGVPDDYLLFVHHKKVPQFLLPELAERRYKWHISKKGPNEVKLLIYR